MNRLSSLFATGLVALTASALTGCNHDQPPPPRYPVAPPTVPGAPVVQYRFPFTGKWRIQRTHYGAKQQDQVWAMDLVPEGGGTEPHTTNATYPCYNVPVLSDAPGIVATVVDGVPDNVPGQKNVYDQHGNYVVIDHQNGEYSLFAHLIPGSVKVRPGMFIQGGYELGRCGNSGMSTLPHIHWQVMDNVNPSLARGIRQRLSQYRRNGAASIDMPDGRDTMENE